MSRTNVRTGTRYLSNNQVFIVREMLVGDRLIVENLSFGGCTIISLNDLYAAWGRGDLSFEVRGPNTQTDRSKQRKRDQDQVQDHSRFAADPGVSAVTIATNYTFADFQMLAPHQRAEAWRRYQQKRPLLSISPSERTDEALDQYALSVNSANKEMASGRGDKPVKSVSRASLRRWLRAFQESGSDIRSLVPATHGQGGKGQDRLAESAEGIIQEVLSHFAASPAYRTVRTVFLEIFRRVALENDSREAWDQIPVPSYNTVYRRIRAYTDHTHTGTGNLSGFGEKTYGHPILRRRGSRLEMQSEAYVLPGPRPDHVLERVEIDHTTLDVYLVDLEDRLPIGRPTITFALDVYSGFPFGLYVSFEPPSYYSVMSCLHHGILPKPDCQALYGTENPWPVFGLPETLVVDNGKEFIGKDLRDACAQLGIKLERLPVRSPWMKGAVERFFRTSNTGLLHTIPGTTFSNTVARGDYNPMRDACMSFEAFMKVLHLFLLDFYAQSWSNRRAGIPAILWQESVRSGYRPTLSGSAQEVRIVLGRVKTRTIHRTGIELWSLRYQSPDLYRLRTSLPGKNKQVRVKYDPGDISCIYVLDTTNWITGRSKPVEHDAEIGIAKGTGTGRST
jgi:putative transposase